MATTNEKAEAARCTRGFHPYDPETRANRAASHRLGHRAKASVGEVFWMHPALPTSAFPTRIAAARAALAKAEGR